MIQAEKEGNTEVYNQLKAALTAAMEAKQATLRPEIQLLNKLLAAEGSLAWRQVLAAELVLVSGGTGGYQLVVNKPCCFEPLMQRLHGPCM